MEILVPGAAELIDWFGYWPTFHDGEVTSIELARSGTSRVVVHTWEITAAVDSAGYYVCRKHVMVTFLLEGIREMELGGFNQQNVLSSLELRREEAGYRLTLEGIYGVDGFLAADSVRIELRPGMPADRG